LGDLGLGDLGFGVILDLGGLDLGGLVLGGLVLGLVLGGPGFGRSCLWVAQRFKRCDEGRLESAGFSPRGAL